MAERKARLVYSTASASASPSSPADPEEPVPSTVVAQLRLETKSRAGKSVTVVDGLPRNAAFLAELSCELKRICATGGAIREGRLELQGDQREAVRRALGERGIRVRG
jgi:translation initiation factor 1